MGWVTVYIRGKSGFKSEVRNHLQSSGFAHMPGFANEKGLALYWIHNLSDLREFKKAIGSKTIFKYRLRFYTTVEEFVESKYNTSEAHEPFEFS